MRILLWMTIVTVALGLGAACGRGGGGQQETFVLGARCVRAPGGCNVIVMGEVQRPGKVAYRTGTTLISALRDAGGLTPAAQREVVVVVRGVQRFRVRLIEVARGQLPDVPLEPGDVIYVPDA